MLTQLPSTESPHVDSSSGLSILQHGNWGPRVSIPTARVPRDPGRSRESAYDLALEVPSRLPHFIGQASYKISSRSRRGELDSLVAQSHCQKACGMGDIVVAIFELATAFNNIEHIVEDSNWQEHTALLCVTP